MKTVKILFFLLFSVLLFSCSTDDTFDIVGSKWQCDDAVYNSTLGLHHYNVYEFISETEVKNYVLNDRKEIVEDKGVYTYTLLYPNLNITVEPGKVIYYAIDDRKSFVDKSATDPRAPYMTYRKK